MPTLSSKRRRWKDQKGSTWAAFREATAREMALLRRIDQNSRAIAELEGKEGSPLSMEYGRVIRRLELEDFLWKWNGFDWSTGDPALYTSQKFAANSLKRHGQPTGNVIFKEIV